jgi:hypothetical protein
MNEYYGKLAGEQDALSSFGLAHGTPRPPPTWAQGWLDTTRKNGTKNLTIPSMREKRAFDPLTLGALGMGAKAMLPWLGKAALGGAASHVGGNIIQKGLRKIMPQLAQRQMASGITHGLENKTMHPVMQRLLSRGLGPEYLAPYQTGQAISKQVAGNARGPTRGVPSSSFRCDRRIEAHVQSSHRWSYPWSRGDRWEEAVGLLAQTHADSGSGY